MNRRPGEAIPRETPAAPTVSSPDVPRPRSALSQSEIDASAPARQQAARDAFFGAAALPCLITDAEGRIEDSNAAAQRLLGDGGSPGLLVLLEPEARGSVEAQLRRLCSGAAQRIEHCELPLRIGTQSVTAIASVAALPTADGAPRSLCWTLQDVSARRAAEDALRRTAERLSLAIDGANDGLWDWNLDSNAIYTSPRCRRILGLDANPDDIALAHWEEQIHPDDRECIAAALNDHLAGTAPSFEAELRIRSGTGAWVWVLARAICVRDAAGRPRRMAGSLSDISRRKQAEQDARQRQAELAYVLRLTTMGEMASGIAHELNQPLAAILNFAKGCALRIQSGKGTADDLLNAIDRIAAQAVRAGDIIKRLRDFVRKSEPQREHVDLNALVRAVAQLVEAEAREHGFAVQVDMASQVPVVEGDAIQLEQVTLNLVRNAFEAVQHCADQRRPLVRLRTRAIADAVEVMVHDNGVGIAPELIDKIFDPFFSTKPTGLGMGLSISRSIIEAHGGQLWCDQSDGSTVFGFRVPCAAPAGTPASD